MPLQTLATLRDILADLYLDEASIRRLVDDVGAEASSIALHSNAKNNWHEVLSELSKHDQVDRLLTLVASEYPTHAGLQTACAEYRQNKQSTSSQAKQRVIIGLGSKPAHYVERSKELKSLSKLMQQGRTALCAVQGMGGVGKSTLARAYAADSAARYPDGVLWADFGRTLREEGQLDALLAGWIDKLGLGEARSYPALRDKLDSLQSYLRDRRVLLVLDDVWHAAPARTLQEVIGERCGFLLTTRRDDLVAALGVTPFPLEQLTPKEALALLRNVRNTAKISPQERSGAEELLKRLGYHPLAIKLAAAYLNQRGRTWQHLLEPLRKRQPDTLSQLELDLSDKAGSLQLCFDESVQALHSDAQACYRQLGVLAADASFCLEDVANLWQSEPGQTRDWLFELIDAALLEVDGQQADWFHLHPLTQDDALTRLDQAGELASTLQRHARFYVDLLNDAKAPHVDTFERHVAQVDAVLQRCWQSIEQTLEKQEANRAGGNRFGNVIRYPANLAEEWFHSLIFACETRYWRLAGIPSKRLHWLPRAAQAAEHNGDRYRQSEYLSHLGNAYRNLGEVERSIDYYEQALAISRAIKDRRGEGNRLNNLGNAYHILCQVEQATNSYEQALAISREIKDRRGEGTRLGNLGIVSRSLGELKQAIDYYEQALVISREIKDRQGECNHLGNLGQVYDDLGEAERAISYDQQALIISREIKDRQNEGMYLGYLSRAYAQQGDWQRALELGQQFLTIAREVASKMNVGEALHFIGFAYAVKGDLPQALEHYQQAYTIFHDGKFRFERAELLLDQAEAYLTLGRVVEARAAAQEAQAIFVAMKSARMQKAMRFLERCQQIQGSD